MTDSLTAIICPQCGATVSVDYGLAPLVLREARRLQSVRLGTIAQCGDCSTWFVLGSPSSVDELMTTDPEVSEDEFQEGAA